MASTLGSFFFFFFWHVYTRKKEMFELVILVLLSLIPAIEISFKDEKCMLRKCES
jgi:hypothetical protein